MANPRVRFRIDLAPSRAVGPGKIALLEAIGRRGSLTQAARDLKLSYKRAWQLLDELNRSFTAPVVEAHAGGRGGGGATLTALGTKLIGCYRSFERALDARAARHFAPLAGQVRAADGAAREARPVRLSSR